MLLFAMRSVGHSSVLPDAILSSPLCLMLPWENMLIDASVPCKWIDAWWISTGKKVGYFNEWWRSLPNTRVPGLSPTSSELPKRGLPWFKGADSLH